MKPVTPVLHQNAHRVVFGRNQPELYYAMPASVDADSCVMTEWELSAEDLATLLNGGRLRLWLLHTDVMKGRPMIPVHLETVE